MMNPADCPADKWYLMEDEEGTVFAGRHRCSSLDGTWTLVSEHGESWLSSNSEIRVIAELVRKDEADAELAEVKRELDELGRSIVPIVRQRDEAWANEVRMQDERNDALSALADSETFDPSDPDALEQLADNLEAVECPIPRKSMTVVHLRRNAKDLRERAARDEQREREIEAVRREIEPFLRGRNDDASNIASCMIDALDAVRQEAK